MPLNSKVSVTGSAFALLVMAVTASVTLADEWSQVDGKEHSPDSAPNRIIKWCSEDGTKTRYASANLQIKNFKPCGVLNIEKSCDASGNRLISNTSDRPRDHRDCDLGPRIMVIRHGEDDIIDASNLAKPSSTPAALTPEEQQALKEELEKASKAQAQYDPLAQLQQFFGIMMRSTNGEASAKDRKELEQAKKQLNQALPQMDPVTRRAVQQFLDVSYWKKVFGKSK